MFTFGSRAILKPIVCATFAIAALVSTTSFAVGGQKASNIEVLISKLPTRESAGYADLLMAAGKTDEYQPRATLSKSKAEVWSITPKRANALRDAATTHKAVVTLIDDTWNHVFRKASPDEAMTPKQKTMMKKTMESKATMGMSMMMSPPAGLLEYALTKNMGIDSPASPAPSLVIHLNETTTIKARRTSISENANGYVWRGIVELSNDPVTVAWWSNGTLTGSLTHEGLKYTFKNMGGGMHGVVEMDMHSMPPEHEPMKMPMRRNMNLKFDPLVKMGDAGSVLEMRRRKDGRSAARDNDKATSGQQMEARSASNAEASLRNSKIVISLIVAYTGAAAQHYADIEKDLIWLAVEDTNQSFRNSGIRNVEVQLAHVYQTDYREKGGHFDHVFGLVYGDDGVMDEIHHLRDMHKADVGLVVVDDAKGCGLAAGVAPPADRAYAAIHHECAATSFSLAHEIGHIVGARHNATLDDTKTPFPFGHGFIYGTKWRTMMSYEESCKKCPRLLNWSNPNILIGNVRAGNALSNNARVIREQAARVAAYR